MRESLLSLRPLTGPALQLSLITPFFLILLVFFVVTPVGSHGGSGIVLPYAPHAQIRQTDDEGLWLSIARDGMVFIDAKWYPAAEFQAKMRALGQRPIPPKIVLRADRSLAFGAIRSALRGAQLAGAGRVFLVTFEGRPIELMTKGAT